VELLIKNCLLKGKLSDISIGGGIIKKIIQASGCEEDRKKNMADFEAAEVIDARGLTAIAGLIDPHVHVRGLDMSYKEDWTSCSRAAASGGVSSIIDMPNTLPPTDCRATLEMKIDESRVSPLNHKFLIGVDWKNISNTEAILCDDELSPMVAGIKIFFSDAICRPEDMKKQYAEIFALAANHEKIIAVHSELSGELEKYSKACIEKSAACHGRIRNRECAVKGTRLALALARDTGAALYLTHVSTAEEIELIKKFRKTAKVYCEITPHHLLLDESIMKNIGNIGKINPPLRPRRDNRALYEAIYDGTADTIGSDHAPHSLEEKALPYEKAPSGFPGLETTLALLTNEVNEKRLELETVSRLTAERPAQIFGFDRRGEIREGYFADIALVDMNRNWRIDAKRFRSKAKFSPFDGLEVKGKNVLTVINGKICYRENSSE